MGGASLNGCGQTPRMSTASPMWTFNYLPHTDDDTMDQLLEIKKSTRGSAAPVLSIQALDANHHVMSRVKVSTVYGSDRGNLVVAYGSSIDVLRFSGPG